MEEKLMTVAQASRRWQISETQIRRNCVSGVIKAYKIGSFWRIPIKANETYVGSTNQ